MEWKGSWAQAFGFAAEAIAGELKARTQPDFGPWIRRDVTFTLSTLLMPLQAPGSRGPQRIYAKHNQIYCELPKCFRYRQIYNAIKYTELLQTPLHTVKEPYLLASLLTFDGRDRKGVTVLN